MTVENGTITGMGLAIGWETPPSSETFTPIRTDSASMSAITLWSKAVRQTIRRRTTELHAALRMLDLRNTANSNADEGLFCSGSGCQITGNTANNNNGIGIECQNDACVISGNTVLGNPTVGIGCFGIGCLISGNAVVNSATGYRSK